MVAILLLHKPGRMVKRRTRLLLIQLRRNDGTLAGHAAPPRRWTLLPILHARLWIQRTHLDSSDQHPLRRASPWYWILSCEQGPRDGK